MQDLMMIRKEGGVMIQTSINQSRQQQCCLRPTDPCTHSCKNAIFISSIINTILCK